MKLNGTVSIKAPRLIVWHFLTNPEAVASCAPGVTLTKVIVPSWKYTATVSAGLSNIQTTFLTEVEFIEMRSPDFAEFRAHGVASNGAVDVVSDMRLAELPGGITEMQWTADIHLVGQLVSLAGGRINMVASHLTDTFIENMRVEIEKMVTQRGFPKS